MSLDWDTGASNDNARCNANWCSNYAPDGRSLCDSCADDPESEEMTAGEEIIAEVCTTADGPLCIAEVMHRTGFSESLVRDAVESLRRWDIICDDGGRVVGLDPCHGSPGAQATLGEWAKQRGD